MYLSDYLHDIPLKALKRIAERLGITVEYHARIKLMNAIDRAFWDGSLPLRLVQALSPEEKRALSLVAFSYGSGVPETVWSRKLDRLSGGKRRSYEGVRGELLRTALMGGVKLAEPVYFSPRGVAEPIRAFLIGETGLYGAPATPVPPASLPSLMEDVIALLAAAYREPLPLTLKGQIRRTVLDRVFAGSPTGEETPESFSAEQRDTLVTLYLRGRGLLKFGARVATVTPELDGWLGLTMTERTQDLATHAVRYHLLDSQTIIPFVGLMTEAPAGTTLVPANLARFLYEYTTASGTAASILPRVRTVLSIFGYLGLLLHREGQYIVTETGARFFRGERHPMDTGNSGSFTMQPNFEVLVGPELDPRVRFVLELMSQRKGRDVVVTSVVDRAGVARARERGMSAAEIISFFTRHSRTALPQNVRFSIESWADAYGSIWFEPVMLMRFRDVATADSVMHLPEVAPFIRERISDIAVTVPAERVSAIVGLLRRSGFLPEVSGESASDPARSGSRYRPATLSGLLAEFAMPEPKKHFIFPEDPVSGATPETTP